MTVKELKKELEIYPDDVEVLVDMNDIYMIEPLTADLVGDEIVGVNIY